MPAAPDAKALALWRLSSLGLTEPGATDAGEVTRRLLASQSQDYRIALWSLAQRSVGLTEAEVESQFGDGVFLRTHVLRPTWHFVHRDDLRLLLTLTAPRVHVANGTYYRREGVDAAMLERCQDLIADALAGGNHLTRDELGAHFSSHGVEASGFKLAYVLMHAELEQLVCSGRPRGRSQTYALFDERVPPDLGSDREHLLAELVFRYFSGHGPATIKDLRWWSSLTIADIKMGLTSVADRLSSETIGGHEYWFTNPQPEVEAPTPMVHLMQTYDEYIVGYQETRRAIDADGWEGRAAGTTGLALAPLFVDGQIRGRWRRTIRGDSVTIDVHLYRPLDPGEAAALDEQASAFARFLGLEAEVVTSPL